MSSHPFQLFAPMRSLRAVVVGAGIQGRAWLTAIDASPDVELAGLVDVDVPTAEQALADLRMDDVPSGEVLAEIVERVGADIVINATIPEAHAAVTLAALDCGRPVLGEKPLAATMSEALTLAAAAKAAGQLFMVSQSRRYNQHLFALRDALPKLGGVGVVTCQFFIAPHFGGFRDEMKHPLLLDMAIHPFDVARFLLAADAVSVYCEEYNPSWSWYAGDAAATAVFEMSDGSRFIYTGSWCSAGAETSWNGDWRLSGSTGSATWDGETPARLERADASPVLLSVASPSRLREGIEGALAEFVASLRTGRSPMGVAGDNLLSLAMVHAAIWSSRTRSRTSVDELLESAYKDALDVAPPAARAVLERWSSVRSGLRTTFDSAEP